MTGEVLPYKEMEATVLATATRLNLPGMNGGLVDARPSVKRLLGSFFPTATCSWRSKATARGRSSKPSTPDSARACDE